jgi:hypothetical protein
MCCPGFPSHPSEEHWNAAQKRPPLVSAIVAMCAYEMRASLACVESNANTSLEFDGFVATRSLT